MWRSEDEMLAVVQRRAAAARDRRLALLTGSTAALVLVAALGVAAVRGPSEDSQQVRVAAPAGDVAPTTTLAVPPTSIDAPPISTRPLPITSPTTTAPRTTTTRPPAATTTTTRPRPAVCTPEDVQAGFAPSKTSFSTGEAVRLTATVRNTSGRECGYSTDGQLFTVRDAAGNSMGADRGASSHVDCIDDGTGEPCGLRWAPGAEESLPTCWDQLRRVGDTIVPVPPGRYTVTVTWSGRVTSPVSATTTVEILPRPAGTNPPPATC